MGVPAGHLRVKEVRLGVANWNAQVRTRHRGLRDLGLGSELAEMRVEERGSC